MDRQWGSPNRQHCLLLTMAIIKQKRQFEQVFCCCIELLSSKDPGTEEKKKTEKVCQV